LAEFSQKRREAKGIVPAYLQQAMGLREGLREASNSDNYELASTLEAVISDMAERIHIEGGETPANLQKARTFVSIVDGAETMEEAFDEWLSNAELDSRTRAKYRTAMKEFAGFIGGHPLVSAMTRANAIRYVDWLNKEGRSQRTKKLVPLSYNAKRDRVMALSAFWNKGLSARDKTGERVNPWSKLEVTERPTLSNLKWDTQGNAGRPKRRPDFDDADLLAILGARGPVQRASTRYPKKTIIEVLSLGLLTGARPDEFCSLTLGDIRKTGQGFLLTFDDAKNADSDRTIPIVHPLAVAVMARRIGERTDSTAMLFEEFRPKQGAESNYELVGRAISRHLARAVEGLPDGAVPYCTRHTLQTRMGNRDDIKDAVMQRYVGHKPQGMTDKHYRNITAESLMEFAKKVSYPEAIERRMAEELELPPALAVEAGQ
jgi:integrase